MILSFDFVISAQWEVAAWLFLVSLCRFLTAGGFQEHRTESCDDTRWQEESFRMNESSYRVTSGMS